MRVQEFFSYAVKYEVVFGTSWPSEKIPRLVCTLTMWSCVESSTAYAVTSSFVALRAMISIGDPSRPSNLSLIWSVARTTLLFVGRIRSSTWPSFTFIPSAASEPRASTETKMIDTGLFITYLASFDQPPSSFWGRCLNNGHLLMPSPSRLNMAGNAISAADTAIPTATRPAKANDLRKYWGKKFMEIMTRATVRPEKNTVLPAESMVAWTDSATSCFLARSSLKRLTIRSA